VMAGNRVKKIAMAMMKPGKKMSEMGDEEKAAFKAEMVQEVERTKAHLAKLDEKKKDREERALRGEPPLDEPAPQKKKIGMLLMHAKRSGVLEQEVEKMEAAVEPSAPPPAATASGEAGQSAGQDAALSVQLNETAVGAMVGKEEEEAGSPPPLAEAAS
jgi:hypothetical protein